VADDDIAVADDLYRLDPSEFVAARDSLARRLRADGQRDDAARVAKLRRPSAAAWALNQAAREHPDLLDTALRAGRELRDATEAALGGDASGLRAASAAERAASDRLISMAAGYLGGGAGAAQQRLAGTLRAAVIDDQVADELRRGVLSTDHESPAFGFATGVELGPPPAPAPRDEAVGATTGRSAAKRTDAKHDAAARKAAERQAAEERRRVAERRRELARLERPAERLALAADAAEAAAVDARASADAAQQELEEARRRSDE
jgi:hypothetical protein